MGFIDDSKVVCKFNCEFRKIGKFEILETFWSLDPGLINRFDKSTSEPNYLISHNMKPNRTQIE